MQSSPSLQERSPVEWRRLKQARGEGFRKRRQGDEPWPEAALRIRERNSSGDHRVILYGGDQEDSGYRHKGKLNEEMRSEDVVGERC